MRLVVNRSITRSIADQLPKQVVVNCPPFRGALTALHTLQKSTSTRAGVTACSHPTTARSYAAHHSNVLTTLQSNREV
jgi:hypothetical protein